MATNILLLCMDICWIGKILSKSNFTLALYKLILLFHSKNIFSSPSDFGLVQDSILWEKGTPSQTLNIILPPRYFALAKPLKSLFYNLKIGH
jgi:hypothetical protein